MVAVHLVRAESVELGARRVAGWLHASGVEVGDRIAVTAANRPETLEVILGALRSGVVPVLLGPHLPREEHAELVADCEPALVVEDAAAAPWSGAAQAQLAPVPLGRPMLYTSGTAGRRKGVWSGVLSEGLARAWAEDEADLWSPDPAGCFLVCSPLHHSASCRSATAALLAGEPVLLVERFDAETVVRLLAEHPVTGAFLVPTHLRRIFELDRPTEPRGGRRFLHAGEPCPDALKRLGLGWFPRGTLWEFYGSTEGQFTAISPEEWEERPGSVGRARRGRTVTVQDAGPDGIGTVFVTGPDFARWEYWRDPEGTARAWRGDAFTVGDLGRLDGDGYLFLSTRRDDLILTGGVNVYPAEVERVLLGHPAVQEAAVFGVPDARWGQRVCAAVVLTDRIGALEEWARARLDGPKRPKTILAVDALPRNASGKVDRGALRSRVE